MGACERISRQKNHKADQASPVHPGARTDVGTGVNNVILLSLSDGSTASSAYLEPGNLPQYEVSTRRERKIRFRIFSE